MASATKGKILAVIGDEDTVVGFLLGGVGELNKVRVLSVKFAPHSNLLLVLQQFQTFAYAIVFDGTHSSFFWCVESRKP